MSQASEPKEFKLTDFPTELIQGEKPEFKPETKLWAIDFWASWCEPCKESIPLYNEMAKKYAAQGVRFLGVSEDETKDEAQKFLKKTPVEFTVLRDDDRKLARKLGLASIPVMYFVDSKGRILGSENGFTEKTKKGFEARLQAELKKAPK